MTESPNPRGETPSGISQLHERRARRARNAPQPRHPKLAPDVVANPTGETIAGAPTADQDTPEQGWVAESDTGQDPNRPSAGSPTPDQDTPEQEGGVAGSDTGSASDGHSAGQGGGEGRAAVLPTFDIDPTDPTAHIVSPTVLSMPESIQHRFTDARPKWPSHTALVLDALRAHVHQLPTLILERRPGLNPGDLFPFRETPGHTSADTPLPLRIRPTKGELAVMKKLMEWASAEIAKQRVGAQETNRSEMVAAALDAFLPPAPKRRSK